MLTKVADIPQFMLDIYSKKLLMDAMPALHFRQLVGADNYKLELGKKAGERIKFARLDNLVGDGMIVDEDTPIQKDKMTGSEVYVTMREFGRAIEFTRKADKASLVPLMENAKKLLGRNYVLTMDNYLRDVYMGTANKFYAKADYTSGAADADVATILNDKVISSVLLVAANMDMPKFRRGGLEFYVFVATPEQIMQIRKSSYFLDKMKYARPEEMLTGEVGMLDGVVFMQTTNMNAKVTTGSSAAGKDVHKGLLIGADTIGYGETIPMELIPGALEDYGRKQSIAWYAIAGAGLLNEYVIEVSTEAGMPA